MRQVTKEAPEGILLLGSRPFQENVAFGHSDNFGIDAQFKKHSCNQVWAGGSGECFGCGLALFLAVKLGFMTTSQGDGVTPHPYLRRKFQLLALSLLSLVLQPLRSEYHQYVTS